MCWLNLYLRALGSIVSANDCAEDPVVVAKRQEMVHSGAVDFGSFGFDDFDEPEAAYV